MAKLQPLRLAFIGGGVNSAVGYTHFASSQLDGLFRLEAGCFSRDPQVNALTASRYNVEACRAYKSWQDLIKSEIGRVDAVVVLTPTPSHHVIIKALLRAGYAVIAEKALASSSQECEKILNIVNENRGFLVVTYNYSGYPMLRELIALFQAGAFGKLHQINVEMSQEGFLRRDANDSVTSPQSWRSIDTRIPTISLDLGVHLHHLVNVVSGGLKPLRVAAVQSHSGLVGDVIDNVNALLSYQDGLLVNFWYGKTSLGIRNGLRVRIYGSDASGEWLQTEPERLTLARKDGSIIRLDPGSPGLLEANKPRYQRFKPGHPSGFIEAFANLYTDIAVSLRIRNGVNLPLAGPVYGADHALDGLYLLEALHESAACSDWISIQRP